MPIRYTIYQGFRVVLISFLLTLPIKPYNFTIVENNVAMLTKGIATKLDFFTIAL